MSKHVLKLGTLEVLAELEEGPQVVGLDVTLNRKIGTKKELTTFREWLLFILKPYNTDQRPAQLTIGGVTCIINSTDALVFTHKKKGLAWTSTNESAATSRRARQLFQDREDTTRLSPLPVRW